MSCRPENLSCNHGENLILVLVFKIVVVHPHSQKLQRSFIPSPLLVDLVDHLVALATTSLPCIELTYIHYMI